MNNYNQSKLIRLEILRMKIDRKARGGRPNRVNINLNMQIVQNAIYLDNTDIIQEIQVQPQATIFNIQQCEKQQIITTQQETKEQYNNISQLQQESELQRQDFEIQMKIRSKIISQLVNLPKEFLQNPINEQIQIIINNKELLENGNFEIHDLLEACLQNIQLSKQFKPTVNEIVALKIDFGTNIKLADLLLALLVEVQYSSRDPARIELICNKIKMKNPEEIVTFLNNQTNELQAPECCETLEQLLQQIFLIVKESIYLQLKEILKLDGFVLYMKRSNDQKIKYLCNMTINEIMQIDTSVSEQSAEFLQSYLIYYQAISIKSTIKLTSNYQDISALTTTKELITLLKDQENLSQQFIDFLLEQSLDDLIDKNILLQNRLVINHRKISSEKLSSDPKNFIKLYNFNYNILVKFNEDISNLVKICQRYSQMYDSILILGDEMNIKNDMHYIGWQKHWEIVIEFVESHILGHSYQLYDLLCILGDPKSGKTASMELSGIFMMNFVRMIRPQAQKRLFCQNKVILVKIDCVNMLHQPLFQKMSTIYKQINALIPQTKQHQLAFEILINNQNLSGVLLVFENIFLEAKCYYVIIWDEMQCLNYVGSNKISDDDEFSIGCFYKTSMVSQRSPCQHLMSGSLSVALLTILKAIPENGRSILRCEQAIVTSFEDNENQLLLIQIWYNVMKMTLNNFFNKRAQLQKIKVYRQLVQIQIKSCVN
ncbi:Hypothetical_protein [Hexamita inflata]|uniref:Hypothetical_protein n=1 Tax=Hexamita inflata TaxID=28002 RepID=A0ABP1H8R8_9EUKA